MKKTWLIAPILLAIIAFFIGRSLNSTQSGNEATESDQSSNTSEYFQTQSNDESIDRLPQSIDPDFISEIEETLRGSISNERILRFKDQESYDAFIAAARTDGIEILDRNQRFYSLRIAAPNRSELEEMINSLDGQVSIERNYRTSLPPSPKPDGTEDKYLPFLQHAKTWLGAPEDTSDWGKGITIAILDTGVNSDEATNIDLIQSSEIDTQHGTAVASVIGRQDEFAIAPAAELLSIRVLDASGSGDTFTLANGIVEAVDRGANIINLSLGTPAYSGLLAEAVSYAQSQDAIIVAAVGNDGVQAVSYPAALEGVIGVGAIDANSQLMDFSNTGQGVDIVAPGYGVESSFEEGIDPTFSSGTSIATPFVSAVLAGILSRENDLSPQQATQVLLENSNDLASPGDDTTTGHGSLDIDRILNRDTPNLYDAALSDFHLDFENATEHMIPLLVTVENRGTEKLSNVDLQLTLESGNPQSIYLGDIQISDTTAHTLYIDRYKFESEGGFSISASTQIDTQEDNRPYNNEKSSTIKLTP